MSRPDRRCVNLTSRHFMQAQADGIRAYRAHHSNTIFSRLILDRNLQTIDNLPRTIMTSPPKKDFLKVKIGRNRSGFSRGIGLTKRIQCEKCDRDFAGRATYRRHVYEQHARKSKLHCSFCVKTFARKHDLDKHIKKNHEGCEPTKDRQLAIKAEPDGSSDTPTPTPLKKTSVVISPLRAVTAETPASDAPPPGDNALLQDAAVQTVDAVEDGKEAGLVPGANCSLGASPNKDIGQRVIERTTRELLGEDGRVVARVTTERFLTD